MIKTLGSENACNGSRCRVSTRMRGEQGGTTGVFDRGIGEKRERERESERRSHTYRQRSARGRGPTTQETRVENASVCI